MRRSSIVAIVSSRQPRLAMPDEPWVQGLRAVLRKIETDRDTLLVGHKTALSDFVRHAANRLFISNQAARLEPTDQTTETPPQRDRAVIFSAEIVYVLTVRSGGNIDQLLHQRLAQRLGPVVIIDLPGLQPESVRTALRTAGAEFWSPSAELCLPFPQTHVPASELVMPAPSLVESEKITVVNPFPAADQWDLLTHSTRSCPGPWPQSTFDIYADSLLESRPDADHSTLGTLKRILFQKRLVASNRMIRGGHQVVSLTECPLDGLASLHRFRTHRFRWDFEPFGLCIRRDWLQRAGARKVVYGNEGVWQTLSETDQPYFQISSGDSATDWSIEQEWRHVGDLDLSGLTNEDVIVFVPDFDSARSISELTRWPITIVPPLSPSAT